MSSLKFILITVPFFWGCASSTEFSGEFKLTCNEKCTEQELHDRKRRDFENALARANFEKIKYYIENKIFDANDILDKNYMNTPLSISSYYSGPRSLEIVEYLIKKGADVNKKNGGAASTPLLTAIWKNRNETAKLLIKYGADINAKSDRGYDSCIFAHRWSNFEIMPFLTKCCKRIFEMAPDDILKEEILRPPIFYQHCKNY